MTSTLGVSCTKTAVLLAVSDNGEIRLAAPDHVEPSELLDDQERLDALLGDLTRAVISADVTQVRLLLPDNSATFRHSEISSRIAHETLVRLAASSAGLSVELLSRSTARSRLGMPTRGAFADLLTADVIGPPVGRLWRAAATSRPRPPSRARRRPPGHRPAAGGRWPPGPRFRIDGARVSK